VTIAFVLFIVGPFLVVGWISAYKASDSIKNEVGRTTLQLVNQNHITLEKTLSSVNDKTITLLDTHFFSDVNQFNFWTNVESLSQISEADEILNRWSSDGTEYTLYVMNQAGIKTPVDLSNKARGFKYFNVDSSGLPEGTGQAIKEGGGGMLRLMTSNQGITTVSFLRSILNPKAYNEAIGLLVVSKLEVLLTRDFVSVELPDNAGIFLFNDQNELLMNAGSGKLDMTNMPEASYRQNAGYFFAKENDGNWLYAYSRRSMFHTSLIYKISLESIVGKQRSFQLTLMFVSAIYLAFVLMFVLFLLRITVKPLMRLVSFTKIYEPGRKLDTSSELLRSDEFGLLYGAFLKMTRRLDTSFEENYVMKIKQKENELSALHSQITPHLLYNTLDSIYWYALDSGNMDVGDMVKDLSKLLRIGLSKGKTMITIEEEAEHVQAYSRLQMKRYPNTFEVHWDIDDSVKPYMTPKVILQPLVENAIFHGVSSMDGEGLIWIRIKQIGEEIVMTVEDNGFLPIDLERLEYILKSQESDRGYGIRNVHKRIQLHYGEAYELQYERREGGGLRAIIRLPVRLE
jgi:two-component system sensor histidine kinase YesM